jgi:hypothetical protein
MPITPITSDYFSGGRNVTSDPDSKRELADLIIEVQNACNANESAVSGAVTSVTGTAPIASSGGTTPAISIGAASGAAAGSMSAAHYTKLENIEANADVTDAANVAAAGARMEAFVATTPADWAGAPVTVQAAIDRIASALAAHLGVPIP